MKFILSIILIFFFNFQVVVMKPAVHVSRTPSCGSKPAYCCDNRELYKPLKKPIRFLITKVGEWRKKNDQLCKNLCQSSLPTPIKIGIPFSYNYVDLDLNNYIGIFKAIGTYIYYLYSNCGFEEYLGLLVPSFPFLKLNLSKIEPFTPKILRQYSNQAILF